MAHTVAKILQCRPNDILDHWGVPELLVAYGHYANEQSHQAFREWQSLPKKDGHPAPEAYAVKFYTDEGLGEGGDDDVIE